MQQAKQSMISRQQIQTADNPNTFIVNNQINTKVLQIIASAEHAPISSFEHQTVISFLAANIIYTNVQRPGVVQCMTTMKFNDRQEAGMDQIVIEVLHHKTAVALGPAYVVINRNIESMMMGYLANIRDKIVPSVDEFQDRLFLTSTGQEFRKISEKIAWVASHYNIKTPTPCLHQKVISTAGYVELDNQEFRLLNTHMSHTPHTAFKYYQFPEKGYKCCLNAYSNSLAY